MTQTAATQYTGCTLSTKSTPQAAAADASTMAGELQPQPPFHPAEDILPTRFPRKCPIRTTSIALPRRLSITFQVMDVTVTALRRLSNWPLDTCSLTSTWYASPSPPNKPKTNTCRLRHSVAFRVADSESLSDSQSMSISQFLSGSLSESRSAVSTSRRAGGAGRRRRLLWRHGGLPGRGEGSLCPFAAITGALYGGGRFTSELSRQGPESEDFVACFCTMREQKKSMLVWDSRCIARLCIVYKRLLACS